MAFASMFIMFLLFCIALCGIITVLGIVLIIVSAVRRRRAVREGRKPKKAGLITGIILIVLPAAVIGVLSIRIALSGDGKESSYRKMMRCHDTLAEGLVSGDSAVIFSAFSESEKTAEPALQEDINGLLHFLGGRISGYTDLMPHENHSQYDENGMPQVRSFCGEIEDAAAGSGKTYRISYSGYSQYYEQSEMIGLTSITVYSGGTVEYTLGHEPE